MGDNLASDRTTWATAATDQGPDTTQADMSVIANSANGFRFRADDHGDSRSTADSLSTGIFAGSFGGKGIINHSTDVDVFKFTTQGGQLQIQVNAATYGPNLIPIAELWSSKSLVARAGKSAPNQSIVNATVPAGTYYVYVKSLGDYGGVGQYSISASTSRALQTFSVTSSDSKSTLGSSDSASTLLAPATTTTSGAKQSQTPTLSTAGASGTSQSIEGFAPASQKKRSSPTALAETKIADRDSLGLLHDRVFEQWEDA
jgi:hypothetical protein